MNEDLHDITEPAISANSGWQQMHALLNQHLPTKQPRVNRLALVPAAYSIVLIAIFLTAGLKLGHQVTGSYYSKIPYTAPAFSTPAKSLPVLKNRILNVIKLPANFTSLKKSNIHPSFFDEQVLVLSRHSLNEKSGTGRRVTQRLDVKVKSEAIKQNGGSIQLPPVIEAAMAQPNQRVKPATRATGTWSVFGGLGINTFLNNGQNLHPYPLAEARFQVTPTFYLAAGLAGWSPVSASTGGISKTIYLNDTINNINLYNEITSYNRLRYADIPLSLGFKVRKNITFQSGLQLSVLLNKKTTKVLTPYDFQMNTIETPAAMGPVTTFRPDMQRQYHVTARAIDLRFVAGIRYAVKKSSVGLMYQQGLQPIGRGPKTNKNKNQVFSLNVLFQIK